MHSSVPLKTCSSPPGSPLLSTLVYTWPFPFKRELYILSPTWINRSRRLTWVQINYLLSLGWMKRQHIFRTFLSITCQTHLSRSEIVRRLRIPIFSLGINPGLKLRFVTPPSHSLKCWNGNLEMCREALNTGSTREGSATLDCPPRCLNQLYPGLSTNF